MLFKSYAKINLGLYIHEKRPDGFHQIETFFQQIDLYDELRIEISADGSIGLYCDSPSCPSDETNLAYRAAALLKAHCNVSSGCKIQLKKNIPAGAGLGGGSSNAATVLQALNSLWTCKLPTRELMQLGAQLGSDVPFFIQGGFAYGTGRGELLSPIALQPHYYGVLILPNIHISTKWVYENYKIHLTISQKKSKLDDFVVKLNDQDEWKFFLTNDLEKVVFQQHSHFLEIIQSFYRDGAFYAAMSGSGSTLFALFKNKDNARKAMLKQEYRTLLFNPVYT